MIAHFQVPGRPDAGGRVGMHGPAQFGAEQPQQQAAPRVEQPRGRPVEQQPDNLPDGTGEFVGQGEMMTEQGLGHGPAQSRCTQSGRAPCPRTHR